MPLLDHFHSPLVDLSSWESFHSNWATRLADALSDQVPPGFRVEEHAHHGPNVEIDIATFTPSRQTATAVNGPATAVLAAPAYAPPAPAHTIPAVFPDTCTFREFVIISISYRFWA